MTYEMLERKTDFNLKRGFIKLATGLLIALITTYLINTYNYHASHLLHTLMIGFPTIIMLKSAYIDDIISGHRLSKVNATEEEKKEYHSITADVTEKKIILAMFLELNYFSYWLTVRSDISSLFFAFAYILLACFFIRNKYYIEGDFDLNNIKIVLSLLSSVLFFTQYFTGFMSNLLGF